MKVRITNINFVHVGRNEGCCCDRCGQYIQNIWYVDFSSGERIRFGIDCFEKVYKKGLSQYGLKMFKRLLRSIEHDQKQITYWETVTEEQARADGQLQFTLDAGILNGYDHHYWSGKPFEEYRAFEIECAKNMLKSDQKEIEKFRKCGFEI